MIKLFNECQTQYLPRRKVTYSLYNCYKCIKRRVYTWTHICVFVCGSVYKTLAQTHYCYHIIWDCLLGNEFFFYPPNSSEHNATLLWLGFWLPFSSRPLWLFVLIRYCLYENAREMEPWIPARTVSGGLWVSQDLTPVCCTIKLIIDIYHTYRDVRMSCSYSSLNFHKANSPL